MPSKQFVIGQALRLSEADRLEIGDALYDSLEGPSDPGVQAAWDNEIHRQIKDIDSGNARLISWSEARKQIAKG